MIYIQVCPSDKYFIWQTNLWLESLREAGESSNSQSLIFLPKGREHEEGNWKQLQELYPEAAFFFYKDEGIHNLLPIYISMLRPYCLHKHWKKYPHMEKETIFYCDNDTYFVRKLSLDKYLQDDICYLSNTNSYINSEYFDSKEKDVIPHKLEEYRKRDILNECCELVGINRQIAEQNKEHSGGAQYLLKNIPTSFWEKVTTDCVTIRYHLLEVNKYYFESESKGFQSWCADMFAVLWNLWFYNKQTKVIPEMDFVWATDYIERLQTVNIYHNAGVTGDPLIKRRDDKALISLAAFYKGRYQDNQITPFQDIDYLLDIHDDEQCQKYCTHYYVEKILDIKHKYSLNY